MAKAQSRRSAEAQRPLTVAQHRALHFTARGEVYRTHSSVLYTLTGPCPSQPLWALARAKLIVDPPTAKQYGRHQMVLSAKGRAVLKLRALNAITSPFTSSGKTRRWAAKKAKE
jgi:hypothetical protein